MATPTTPSGPRSPSRLTPSSPTSTLRKDKKDDSSFLDKIGTIGRKKKAREAQDLQEEGMKAIESAAPTSVDQLVDAQAYNLEENEKRSMVDPSSRIDPKLKSLIQILLDWINDELADYRIIVKDIEEDLYDGQVLQKLVEKLTGTKMEVPEVTQSEIVQLKKLRITLDVIARELRGPAQLTQSRWSAEAIHAKGLVAILHLLVALARHYRAPIRLPDNVTVTVIVVQKQNGQLSFAKTTEEITNINEDIGAKSERDAFDTLFDHAPDKLSVVKKSLVSFVNKHLNKVNFDVTDLDRQFQDGVYMCMLMGLLESYFVPLHCYYTTPATFEQKVHNVNVAFSLMDDAELPKPKARPEDIVNGDLKSTLRVLYNLFTRYKNVP